MDPATRALIKALLLNHSADDTVALASASLSGITKHSVYAVRTEMVKAGEIADVVHGTSVLCSEPSIRRCEPVDRDAARMASTALLRRQLIHTQHQITCPTRFASVCASVGLALAA